jgi:hypothetical protein
MFELISRYGLLDPHYWMWVTAAFFILTVVRDIVMGSPCARGS